ncbi:MAG: hypothetical protein MUO82_12090 [Candidatus Thermoplasmatota archaeon]|nr:hypothetical protein [Candidatus Thermoplasmatota archaeon]
MEHMLDVLYDFYMQDSVTRIHIGQIRDTLQQRTNANVERTQVTRCGITLAKRGFIRIESNKGKNPLPGWVDAIILQEGISHIKSRGAVEIG